MEINNIPPCSGHYLIGKGVCSEKESTGWLRMLAGILGAVIILYKLGAAMVLFGQEKEIPIGSICPINISIQDCAVNRLPLNWKARDVQCAAKVYSVQQEAGNKYIHADSRGTQDQIGSEARWSLRNFPILQWQWRAVHFPTGSDERVKSRNDSVLGLYVIFGHFPFIKTIKYIWSDTLPVGTCFPSPYSSTTRIVVIRSGRAQQGSWVTESRDVLADYIRICGEGDKNPVAVGIGLLTDSDDTRSRAIGDYAEFKALPADTIQLAGH